MKLIPSGLILLIIVSTHVAAQHAGTAVFTDGVNDYVESLYNIDIFGNADRTAALWIKSSQLYTNVCCPTPFSWGNSANSQGFGNFIGSGKWHFWGYWNDFNTGVSVNLEWNHHCITYDGDTVIYYLNGNIIGSQAKNLTTANSNLFIGDGFDHRSDTHFKGWIDEVRIWKRTLSQEEIKEIIFRRLLKDEISDSTLVCYWTFNEGYGSHTADSSLMGNNGKFINMDTSAAWINSTIPMATYLTENLYEISAIWAGVDSNFSSILSIHDTSITGNENIIFAHNGDSLQFDTTDTPDQSELTIRLKRVWKIETGSNLNGDIIFNTYPFDTSGIYGYMLLVDSDGLFFNADTYTGYHDTTRSIFIVKEQDYVNGYYYALGAREKTTAVQPEYNEKSSLTFNVSQNYPNPFNPSTTIKFQIPNSEFVILKVYNVLGKEVSTLVSNKLNQGNHTYTFDGRNLASGIYYCQLVAGEYMEVKKMILLR